MTDMPSEQSNVPLSVEVVELSHRYDSYLAVDRISFGIKAGMTFGLIGPNGAGKSTTIKMLTTLLPVTSGYALINGYNIIEEPSQVRQTIGYVPQLLSADGELTGYENLLISAKLYGLTRDYRQKRIREVLEFMNLSEFKDKLVNSYSGGMIRRLEIAQALVHQPPVLFLDEPTVGLDPAARKILWGHIQGLNKQIGTTILMTTHDMEEADALCDIVALVYLGRIIVMDTPDNLKAALGPKATLDDVFIYYTGSSLKETGDYGHVKQTRTTISHL
jgi:ABC-2 type transport system ATP-binding protein